MVSVVADAGEGHKALAPRLAIDAAPRSFRRGAPQWYNDSQAAYLGARRTMWLVIRMRVKEAIAAMSLRPLT